MVQTTHAFTTTGGPSVAPAANEFTSAVAAAHTRLLSGLTKTKPHRIASILIDGVIFHEQRARERVVPTVLQVCSHRRETGS